MEHQASFCTFRVGSTQLGVEVHRVQEVIRKQAITRIPGASEVVRGLMNLRGQIVTAVDLPKRMGLVNSTTDEPLMNVVIRTSESSVSLLVHEIGDVVVVEGECLEPLPETLQGGPRDLIRGAYKLEAGLLLVLDTDAVLDIAA